MKRVLFLCSGNYYRSRFAEIQFNWLAKTRDAQWRADSRGLAVSAGNPGPISADTLLSLRNRGIECKTTERFPLSVNEADFAAASHIVAVKEREHRSMIDQQFPNWIERLEFWSIDDLDCAEAEVALPILEVHVRALFDRLTAVRLENALTGAPTSFTPSAPARHFLS